MTLHYQFPTITCLSDVLPAIKDCPEFIVVKKETGITVVNYVMVGKDTFPPVVPPYHCVDGTMCDNPICYGECTGEQWRDETAAIRRECRGLIFDTESGALIARRLTKFFNLGEREDTTTIDVSRPHVILEKLDGSMVTPFPVKNDGIRWGTKMGITGVSMQAECFVATRPEYDMLAKGCFESGVTPIFEWCSNKQRIVVDQPEDRLVLLHLRWTKGGNYLPRPSVERFGKIYDIPIVRTFPVLTGWTSLDQMVQGVRAAEGTEGVVICFDDGHMVKVKSDWYVSLHRVKASIEKERDVARLIVTDKTDDLVPLLSDSDKARLAEYTDTVFHDVQHFAIGVSGIIGGARANETTRKQFAMNSKYLLPAMKASCFHLWDEEITSVYAKAIEWAHNYIARNSLSNESFINRAKQILLIAEWDERRY